LFDSMGFYIQISEEDYQKLLCSGVMTQRIDRESGFVEFEYTNFRVSHSFNYRVQWKVDNRHMVKLPEYQVPQEVEGIPYLRLEFSVPKILHGHNLLSVGMDGVIEACAIVKAGFEKMSGVVLDGPGDWYVYRVDVCANFELETIDEVKSYIRYLQRLDYPRRIGNAYKNTGMYFGSVHNTLKIYCKGAEFKKHDAERFISDFERFRYQKQADKILRIEVELKRRLKYLIEQHEEKYNEKFLKFKGYVSLDDLIYIVDFKNEMERVMQKFLVSSDTKIMRSLEVLNILKSILKASSARSYYALYMLLVTQGQEEVKRQVSKSQYYRALKIFRECKISIIASDIEKKSEFNENSEFQYLLGLGFPVDFKLNMDNSNKYYQLPRAA
jgi:II/X family phage/plasmid replication protein